MMTLPGSITEITADDSEAVRAVINASNYRAYRSVIPAEHFREEVLPVDAMPDLFERMTFYGYWHEGRLAGVAALMEGPENTARMRWVYVHPEFQRMGVGTALVGHLEERAKRTGFAEMRLRTAEGAHWAISFYRRLGYRVTARTPRPWGADIEMRKSLRPAE